jgi:hypothetical protein
MTYRRCIGALRHMRLVGSPFSQFAACCGAPSHRSSQGRTTPIFKTGLQQGFAVGEMGLGLKLHSGNLDLRMSAKWQKRTLH